MIEEDIRAFFEDGEECSHGGHTFFGHLYEPSRLESFDQADVMTRRRTFSGPAEDIQTAGIQQGSQPVIDGRTFSVLHPIAYSACGRIATLQLGSPQ